MMIIQLVVSLEEDINKKIVKERKYYGHKFTEDKRNVIQVKKNEIFHIIEKFN